MRAFVGFLHDTAEGDWVCVMLGEPFTADVKRIESVGAVGSMLEQVFFGFGLLLHRLVLMKAVSTPLYSCRLDGQDQVVIVLAVEERHEALLASEALIYQEIFFVVAHRVAKVHILYLPPVALEFVDYHVAEVLIVNGIVRAESCSVVVENHCFILVVSVISTEVVYQSGDFPLELHIEGL